MDTVSMIRIVAGVLAVVVLVVIVWRRRKKLQKSRNRSEASISHKQIGDGMDGGSANHRNGAVYVYNKTRETFVATDAIVADSYLRRLVGLSGKNKTVGTARRGFVDQTFPGRAHHRYAIPHRLDFSRQGKRGRRSRRIRPAISNLARLTQSDQRT